MQHTASIKAVYEELKLEEQDLKSDLAKSRREIKALEKYLKEAGVPIEKPKSKKQPEPPIPIAG